MEASLPLFRVLGIGALYRASLASTIGYQTEIGAESSQRELPEINFWSVAVLLIRNPR
jgi:hypothetical protein